MTKTTDYRMWGVYGGLCFLVFWLGGLLLAGWLPPISASLSAAETAALIQENQLRALMGTALMTLAATFYLPWTITLSSLIEAIDSRFSWLSKTQIVGGVMAQATFFIPPYFWAAAAYRTDRNPEITQSLLDIGWLFFITGIGPFILQYVMLAVAMFTDKSENPLFPRWLAFLQIWLCIAFLPAVMPFFLKTGPFAWNGIFVWWLPFAVFGTWYFSMLWFARKAVLRT